MCINLYSWVEVFGWIFVKNAVSFGKKCGEKINSPYFTAFLTKIHRISYKNSPHLFSNVYLNSQEMS